MIYLQIISEIDVNKMPLYALLIMAIYYLWKSYQSSIERAINREKEVYDRLEAKLDQLNQNFSKFETKIIELERKISELETIVKNCKEWK
jgi:predicted  nucleic acid-binding Zn-ribbon protein